MILKKYVLRELVGPTILGLLFFTFLLFITRIFRLADILMSEGVNPILVGRFAFCLLPALLSFTVPCAVLVGVLISFGRLAADNEILAIRTSGIHLMTIFRPVMIFGLLLSVFMMVMNYAVIPNLNFKSMDYLHQIEFQLFNTLRPGRFYDELSSGDTDMTFYFADRDQKTRDLLGVHIKLVSRMDSLTGENFEEEPQKARRETLLLSERGRIIADKDTRALRLQLWNGSLHPLTSNNPGENSIIFFEELSRDITPNIGNLKRGVYKKKEREMTVPELQRNIIANLEVRPKESRQNRVALLQRFSNPLACLAFIIIGIPLAIYIRPSGKSAGFAISFGLLFFYYLLMKWGASLGEVGHPLAPLAIFSPNIILIAIGSVLIYLQSIK